MRVQVFYAGLLYKDFETKWTLSATPQLFDLPDGAYYRYDIPVYGFHWRKSDHTLLADEDVPKELLTLALLLT